MVTAPYELFVGKLGRYKGFALTLADARAAARVLLADGEPSPVRIEQEGCPSMVCHGKGRAAR